MAFAFILGILVLSGCNQPPAGGQTSIAKTQVEVQAETANQEHKMASCAGATLFIDTTYVKPTWYSALKATKVVVANQGSGDLNDFKVYAYYSDGSTDLNIVSLNLAQGSMRTAWTKGGPEAGGTKPTRVVIESVDCGTKVEVLGEEIETG